MSKPCPAPNAPTSYFAPRRKIHPRAVMGRFRQLKWILMILTLGVYYLAPFLRWDRGPHAPDQAILIDLTHTRAYWFFIEIWPQEIYYITAILIFAAIALFYVTSLLGRVWCGYFCPQTVWSDLFIHVERLIQGDAVKRRRLDAAPWGVDKIIKKTLTHVCWLIIALCTGGAFVFYFNDAPTLWGHILNGTPPVWPMVFVAGLTVSTYLMAGFAREQVCTYMCPYARFQSAMFDRETLVIGYDEGRGEPRGKHRTGATWAGRGHCIDCTACVQVCPMGIDIRHGLQIDCIACGLCIDACDQIMGRVGLPRGLIRYDSTRHLNEPRVPLTWQRLLLRPRSIYYLAILSIVAGIVAYSLITRAAYEVHIIHDRNPLFVTLSNGDIRNGYEIRVVNKTHEPQVFTVLVTGLTAPELSWRGRVDYTSNDITVPPASVNLHHLFVRAAAPENAKQPIVIELNHIGRGDTIRTDTVFISKGQ